MSYCNSRIVIAPEGRDKVAASLPCRSWTCPSCADQRRRQLVAHAISGKPNKLLTLTSRRVEGQKAEPAARALVDAWKVLFREVREQPRNDASQFLAIFEGTQLHWPHLHILLRSQYLDQGWLSTRMGELTNSPIVDIRRIKNKYGAARYVAKYTAKAPDKFGTLKRYWSTPAWEVERRAEPRAPLQWSYHRHDLGSWIAAYEESGFTVERTAHNAARAIGAASWVEEAAA